VANTTDRCLRAELAKSHQRRLCWAIRPHADRNYIKECQAWGGAGSWQAIGVEYAEAFHILRGRIRRGYGIRGSKPYIKEHAGRARK